MAARKFTVTIDGKLIGKRGSKSRTYTHAILGQANQVKLYEWLIRSVETRATEVEGDYYRFWPEHTVRGFARQELASKRKTGAVSNYEYAVRKGKDVGTLEQYLTKLRNAELESHDKAVAAGAYDLKVLQWSQSKDNADKAAMTKASHYLNVRVVEVDQVAVK